MTSKRSLKPTLKKNATYPTHLKLPEPLPDKRFQPRFQLRMGIIVFGLSAIALASQTIALAPVSQAQVAVTAPEIEIPPTPDGQRFQELVEQARAQEWHQQPIGDIVQAIAAQLQGAEYEAGLLDRGEREELVVSLTQFDCVLFVEIVLALARGVAVQDYTYGSFRDRVEEQRYWLGTENGYCSRLHYFSEWLDSNQRRGIVQRMGDELGGLAIDKELNFMSTHRSSYRQLSSEENFRCIRNMEANLEARRRNEQLVIRYIPTDRIQAVYPQLQPGDIIGVATSIPGLDVTHTGLVYRTETGNIGLIHASPAGSVTVAPDLQRYISNVDRAIGILVARPNSPQR